MTLEELFGRDWSVAYVDYCPGDDLAVLHRAVDVSFVPCADPDFSRTNVVLLDSGGNVVRWLERALPAAVLFGCFTPDAPWRRDPTGFSELQSGDVGVEACIPIQ